MTKVIIIDDDSDAIQVFRELLEAYEIQVVGTGHSGNEAVDLYQKLRPDVVLLEMKMPEVNGRNAIKEIKEFDSDAKIIIISGQGNFDFREENVYAFFPKPYDIKKIVEAIKKIPVKNHK